MPNSSREHVPLPAEEPPLTDSGSGIINRREGDPPPWQTPEGEKKKKEPGTAEHAAAVGAAVGTAAATAVKKVSGFMDSWPKMFTQWGFMGLFAVLYMLHEQDRMAQDRVIATDAREDRIRQTKQINDQTDKLILQQTDIARDTKEDAIRRDARRDEWNTRHTSDVITPLKEATVGMKEAMTELKKSNDTLKVISNKLPKQPPDDGPEEHP